MCGKPAVCLVINAALALLMATLPNIAYADPDDSTYYILPNVVLDQSDSVVVPFSINCVHDLGGLAFSFTIPEGLLQLEDFTPIGTLSEWVDIWAMNANMVRSNQIHGIILYDYPDFLPPSNGPVGKLIFSLSDEIQMGSLLSLTFLDNPEFLENSAAGPQGIAIFFPEFIHGSIQVNIQRPSGTIPQLGDVNGDGLPYDTADYLLIAQQLLGQPIAFTDELVQTANSDANRDGLAWTVSDFMNCRGIASGALGPVPSELGRMPVKHESGDSIWFNDIDATPGSAVEATISLANGHPAGAITYKLEYDPDALGLSGIDFSGSRLPSSWDVREVTEVEDGLVFAAWPSDYQQSLSDPIPAGSGTLVRLTFDIVHPPEEKTSIHFARYQHNGHMNGYARNGGPLWYFASLQALESLASFEYVAGDANSSGFIDIDDVVFLIRYLFSGGPTPTPIGRGDFNYDSTVDLHDAEALLLFIFG